MCFSDKLAIIILLYFERETQIDAPDLNVLFYDEYYIKKSPILEEYCYPKFHARLCKVLTKQWNVRAESAEIQKSEF